MVELTGIPVTFVQILLDSQLFKWKERVSYAVKLTLRSLLWFSEEYFGLELTIFAV